MVHAENVAMQALMLAASVDCVAAVDVLLKKGATLELQARSPACDIARGCPGFAEAPALPYTPSQPAPTCGCVRG